MSTFQTVCVALGGLAGGALILKWTGKLFIAWLTRLLSKARMCGFCYREPATLEIDLKDGNPIDSCEACFTKKGSPMFREHLRERGQLKPITESAALTARARAEAGR